MSVAAAAVAVATPLSEKVEQAHENFLEQRRELLPSLRDRFQLAPKATVIQEQPEPWTAKALDWHYHVTAKLFWVGQKGSASSWDKNWQTHFGGVDHPARRSGYICQNFIPQQSPFYIALPYNDLSPQGTHTFSATREIPWFWSSYKQADQSVCEGRWLMIHRKGKICYAQWRDTYGESGNDANYVFGRGQSLNPVAIHISPAIRDYLATDDSSRLDWKFIENRDVPDGPWKTWQPRKK